MFILFSKFTVINDKQWAACSRLRAPRSQKLLIGHALISNGWKFSFLKQENLAVLKFRMFLLAQVNIHK